MSHASPRGRRGFTLVEVLVAIGIAAIGLAAVLAVITNSAANAASQRTRTLASWIALNQIVQMRLGGALPAADVSKGDLEYAADRWHWEQNVTQTDVPGIRRIDVRVRRADDAEGATRATLTGFVGRVQTSAAPAQTDWDSATAAQAQPSPGGGTTTSGPGANGQPGSTNGAANGAGNGATTAPNPAPAPNPASTTAPTPPPAPPNPVAPQ